MFRDFNVKKKPELKIKNVLKFAESIIRSIREPLVVLDKDLRVILANKSFYDKFNLTPLETENKLFYELKKQQWNIPKLRHLLEEILPKNTVFEAFEIESEFEDLGPRVLLLNARKLIKKHKKSGLILLAFEDITEQRQYEEKLLKLNMELEKKVEDRVKEIKELKEDLIRKEKLIHLGKFASVIGHELRNPLAVMNNSVYFLTMILKNPQEKVIKHLTILNEQIVKAERIISNVLDFTRTKEPCFEECEVNELIESSIQSIEIPQNIMIIKKFADNIPPLLLDPSLMQQAFHNLISNAIDAMPDGGTLEIDTIKENDFAKINFKDTGIGIPKKNLKKIFEPLFTTKMKGFGLGLSIVLDIIESHKGKIAVKSSLNEGSIFILQIPF
ncbi:MAG: two-component system sensor histidine kinase NtrB [Promethearchaeota archaeon]